MLIKNETMHSYEIRFLSIYVQTIYLIDNLVKQYKLVRIEHGSMIII